MNPPLLPLDLETGTSQTTLAQWRFWFGFERKSVGSGGWFRFWRAFGFGQWLDMLFRVRLRFQVQLFRKGAAFRLIAHHEG